MSNGRLHLAKRRITSTSIARAKLCENEVGRGPYVYTDRQGTTYPNNFRFLNRTSPSAMHTEDTYTNISSAELNYSTQTIISSQIIQV